MPADHARKGHIRRRKADTGESYTEAAKALRKAGLSTRAVWDPWVAPRCEVPDPIAGHDPWMSGPCPEGCPTRDLPDYRAYLETLPPKERLPRPLPERETYECPGPASCTEECCNFDFLTMCWVCEAVYTPEVGCPCPNCGRNAQ